VKPAQSEIERLRRDVVRLKAERDILKRTAGKTCRARDRAMADVLDYIERFCNPRRRHSTLGYLGPVDFE